MTDETCEPQPDYILQGSAYHNRDCPPQPDYILQGSAYHNK
jgi:hypothetical protein